MQTCAGAGARAGSGTVNGLGCVPTVGLDLGLDLDSSLDPFHRSVGEGDKLFITKVGFGQVGVFIGRKGLVELVAGPIFQGWTVPFFDFSALLFQPILCPLVLIRLALCFVFDALALDVRIDVDVGVDIDGSMQWFDLKDGCLLPMVSNLLCNCLGNNVVP